MVDNGARRLGTGGGGGSERRMGGRSPDSVGAGDLMSLGPCGFEELTEQLVGEVIAINEEELSVTIVDPMFRIPVDESLDLVLLEPRHAPMLYSLIDENRAHLRRFLPWVDATRSVNDSAIFIQSCLEQFARGMSVNVALFTQNQIVGVCGTHTIQWAHRRTEMGYWLASAWQGRGLMSRAVHALGTYCFAALGLNRLELRAAVENKKSRAIAERLGLKYEGTIRQAEWLYDHYVDHAMYGILGSEWRATLRT